MIQIRDVVIGEGKPKVCVAITGETEAEILEQAQQAAESPAEIIEWRADCFENWQQDNALMRALKTIRMAITDKVLIFSFRTSEEGGTVSVKDEEYIHVGKLAVVSRLIDILDVECCVSEYRSMELIAYAKERNVLLLGSNFSFRKSLSAGEMEFRIRYMQKLGIDLARIAVSVDRKRDVHKLLNTSYELCEDLDFPLSVLGLSEKANLTHAACEFFGSCMTFATLREDDPSIMNVYKLAALIELLHEIS